MESLNYKKLGSGKEKIIVMHEWMGDCSNYNLMQNFINTEEFTWYFVDFRGYGVNKEFEGQFCLSEVVEDIAELINTLKLEKVHLLAHSMSTFVAQKIVLKIPSKIASLVLITPIAPSGIKMKEDAKNKLLSNVKNENSVIEQVVNSSSKRYTQKWKDYRIDLSYTCSTNEAKLGYMKMYLEEDFTDEFKDLKKKILIITGKYDLPAFLKTNIQKVFSKYYESFQLIEIQEAGHYPMLETPILFVSLIEQFLKDNK